MVARWIALAFGLVTLVIVGIFVVAVLRPPPMIASGTNVEVEETISGAKRFTGGAGPWTVMVDLAQGPVGVVAIVMWITDADGRPAAQTTEPKIALSMVDMAMGKEAVPLVREAAGRWRGSGRLSMAGRWNLEVDIDGATLSLPFEAASR